MSKLELFNDMINTHADDNVSDEVINTLINKLDAILSPEEIELLEQLGSKLMYAKVKDDFEDRYELIDSSHLNNIFKRYIWNDSDEWADEMFSVTDGIMSNLNMFESDALKQFIVEINKKDNIHG